MKKIITSFLSGLWATTTLIFVSHSVLRADELYRETVEELEMIAEVQQDLDSGKVTKENWQKLPRQKRRVLSDAINPTDRQRTIEGTGNNAAGKKALATAYEGLAQAAAKQGIVFEEEMDTVLKFIYEKIVETKESVNQYKSGDLFIVDGAHAEWLLRAISKREYKRWLEASKIDWASYPQINQKKIDQVFAELASVAALKIPVFKPKSNNFSVRDSTEEKMLQKAVGNTGKIKILKIGLAEKKWNIQKDPLGVPEKRFKTGYLWIKNTADDYPYCHLYQVNIIQDYAGGGKYGSSYAKFLGDWLAGCK
jgi:hypothetical protein